jgi:poly-gamma-glutamate synthesis protein (capsule biosynthesis protein)
LLRCLEGGKGHDIMKQVFSRRRLLLLPLAFAAVPGFAAGVRDVRVALLGQSLITHDLRRHPWPGLAPIVRRLREHDVCFSDLEVVLRGARAGAPTRDPAGVHAADAAVLDCLGEMGINLLATSNNHAFDLGTGGIIDTMEALRARGMVFAGTGMTLAEAAAPAILESGARRVALVSAAAGMIREGGAATASRAGVNEIRKGSPDGLDPTDVDRVLESIRVARRLADVVIAYLHNHLWEDEVSRTAAWQRDFARKTIDAGASVFVAHGPPLLHGIEMYRGTPLFHGLGSFIFQTRKAPDAYGPRNWRSLIAECRFRDGAFVDADLLPLGLASLGERGSSDFETRGRPTLAEGGEAAAILVQLAEQSALLGYRLRVRGERAVLRA